MFKNYTFSTIENFDLFIPHNIVSLSYTDLTKSEPSIPHSHQYTEIMIVAEGSGSLVINNQKIAFHPGELYFVNPNTEHLEYSEGTLKYYVLKVNNFTVSPMSGDVFTDTVNLAIDYGAQKHILTRFSQLMENCEIKDAYKKTLVSLDLAYLYYYFIHILTNRYHVNRATPKRNSSKIQAVVNYISANYGLDLKIDEIAKQFSFSPRNLLYHFQKEMGTSPSEFIVSQRMQAAKNLLQNTDFTITQISSMCGFSTPAFFTKTFRNSVGVTPSEYRIATASATDSSPLKR